MATKLIRQTMFTTGEADVTTWKRTDVNEYMTAAQSLLNVEVGTTGLAKKRKGTSLLFNATGYAQFNSRMYEFVDNFIFSQRLVIKFRLLTILVTILSPPTERMWLRLQIKSPSRKWLLRRI
jgi:hypothetical protein